MQRSLLVAPFACFLFTVGFMPLLGVHTASAQQAFFIDATGSDFMYYSLEQNRPVPPEVSDTGGWDLAFKGSEIRVNGAAQFVDVPFDSLQVAPEDGFAIDTPEEPALPTGSGKGWFNYGLLTLSQSTLTVVIFVSTKADEPTSSSVTRGEDNVGGGENDPVPVGSTRNGVSLCCSSLEWHGHTSLLTPG